jgi:hypothetical protein
MVPASVPVEAIPHLLNVLHQVQFANHSHHTGGVQATAERSLHQKSGQGCWQKATGQTQEQMRAGKRGEKEAVEDTP